MTDVPPLHVVVQPLAEKPLLLFHVRGSIEDPDAVSRAAFVVYCLSGRKAPIEVLEAAERAQAHGHVERLGLVYATVGPHF